MLGIMLLFGSIPQMALALKPSEPNTITESYINEASGKEFSDAVTVKTTEIRKPQEIKGYVYSGTYSENIEHVYSRDDLVYLYGYPDKTVRGERYLSRAEATAIFFRLYDGYYPKFTKSMSRSTFSDVSTEAWYYKELETLYNIGIVSGYEDGTFKPDEPVSRAEFARMAAEFNELERNDKAIFSDVSTGHWAYQYINAAYDAGWISGYEDGTYKPDQDITRAETVSMINKVINREITAQKLKELGIKSPYTDLVESYWAYADLIEATVKHAASDWHEIKYNNGKFNVLIETFVDADGKEISKKITTDSKENTSPKKFENYTYHGYIRTVTYTYKKGSADMSVKKSVSTDKAKVGDKISYNLEISNLDKATSKLTGVFLKDKLPEYVDFVDGSVQVNGKSATYGYDDKTRELSIELDSIEPAEKKTVKFSCTVNESAYGKSFKNVAIASADNNEDEPGEDDGIEIEDGKAKMNVVKSVDKPKSKVGETLVYTVKISNDESANIPLKAVKLKDSLPEFVKFTQGSVHVDGKTASYNYDNASRLLTVELGDIEPNKMKTVTFECVIESNAYGQSFKNVAVGGADNHEEVPGTDEGVDIEDGKAKMSTTKSVSKDKAKVGDSLVYTVKISSADTSEVNLRNVVMNDILSEFVTFTHGSVQVDGVTVNYSYDNAKRLLSVPLLEIAPGQTKTVTFEALVNTQAYGKTFNNTAVASADNEDDKPVTDGGVTVEDGTPEGSAGSKLVDKSAAKVNDTLTYTLTLRNSASATSEWTAKIKDIIPEHLSFINGSVEEDGRATTNYSYDANTRTLTLFADSIAIGADKKFTFKVTVDDGAQGLYIVNTAVVSSDGRDDIQLPDTGVQIEAGKTDPIISKKASVKESAVGSIYSYEIAVKNGGNASSAWKNVVVTDVIPDGLKLVAGTVTLDGKTVSYGLNGEAIEVTVGDLPKNTESVIRFEVRVLEEAAGKKIKNVAVAKGNNGEKTGTDTGVTIPKPIDPTDPNGNEKAVTGSKDVNKTLVSVQDKVEFTITAKNNTEEIWKWVQVYDVLDTSMVTLITDTMFVDGIKHPEPSGKWSFSDKTLTFTLGDIEPGKEVVCKFSVQIKNDAAGHTYINHATIKSSNGKTVYVKAPEVVIIASDDILPTDNHYKLFVGHGDNLGNPLFIWDPDGDIQIDHMFILGYRLMTDDYRKAAGNGTITVPSGVTSREAQYFISHGVISANEYTSGAVATQSQVYRILNATTGANLSSNSTAGVKRIDVANLVCDFTKRDKTPNTNGLPLAFFSDKGTHAGLIDEVSNSHEYTKDSSGNETWTKILQD